MTGKRILVVEDNPDNMALVRTLLKPLGVSLTEVKDGPSALRIAQNARFDLVLLDIQIPVMDGYAVVRALRRLEHFAQTPIVAVTSYAMTGDRDKAIAAGCTGYIEKPLNPDTFVEKIGRILRM